MTLSTWGARDWLNAFASVAMIGASAVLIWLGLGARGTSGAMDGPAFPAVPIDHVEFRGNSAIKVVVFSDYYCPACRQFANDVLPEIVRAYVDTGQISFAYAPFPITQNGGRSMAAATMAQCARRQGLFWESHEFLTSTIVTSDFDMASTRGKPVPGHDRQGFAECLADPKVVQSLIDYVAKAREAGIRATPTTVIGELLPDGTLRPKSVLTGGRTVSEMKAVLDRVLR